MHVPQAALAALLALQCALEHPVMCQQTSTSNIAAISPPSTVYKRLSKRVDRTRRIRTRRRIGNARRPRTRTTTTYKRCPKEVRRTRYKTGNKLIGIRQPTSNTTATTYILTMETCPPAKQQCCGKSIGCCKSNDIWSILLYVLFAFLGVGLVAVAVVGTYNWCKRKRARRADIQPPIPSGPPTQPGYYPASSLPQPPAYAPSPPPPPPPGFAVPPMPDYAPPPAMGYPSPPLAVPSPPPSPGYPLSAPTGYGSPPPPPANPSPPVNANPV